MARVRESERRGTREVIVQSFCTRVRTAPLSKLRIADLINELGINRNTFYYYFTGKYDVALYAFRHDMDHRLRAHFPESELITSCGKNDPFEGLAFYACTETGARNLDHTCFVQCLMQAMADDTALYRNLFTYHELEFIDQISALWKYAMLSVIEKILDGRYMAPEVRDMLATYACQTLVGTAQYSITHASQLPKLLDQRINPFQNSVLEMLRMSIQKHPLTPTPTYQSSQRLETFSASSPVRPRMTAAMQ